MNNGIVGLKDGENDNCPSTVKEEAKGAWDNR